MGEESTGRDVSADIANLSHFQRTILAILAAESRYGLAVKKALQDYYGESVNHGQLYPNLDELVENGFVEKAQLDRRTNEYQLTDAGYEAMLEQFGWEFDYLVQSEDRVEDIQAVLERARSSE